MVLQKLSLSKEDRESWLKVAGLFLFPVIVIYITYVLTNMGDGFQWSDFVPNLIVQGAMVAYILNEILAYIKKWKEANQ
jgi:hypothetical protein